MSALRQRQISADKPNGGTRHSDISAGANIQRSPPRSSSCLWSVVLVSVALSVGLLYYRTVQTPLPASYALCSREGRQIYTVDEINPRVQCFVVHNSHIVDTGSLDDVKRRWDNERLTVQQPDSSEGAGATHLAVRYVPHGSVVVPGLSDSHAHILEYGASRQLPLEGGKTIQDTVAIVRKYIKSHPEVYNDTSKFIEGWGWDHTSWPTEEWPSAADLDLDKVVKDRPVVLQSKDGHALWVSSKVLELSGPFPDTVEGGVIVRDLSGKPTGVFLDNAQELVKRPPLTEVDLYNRFTATVRDAVSLGLTSIHDAGFNVLDVGHPKEFASVRVPEDIPHQIRIYGMTFFDELGEYWGNRTKPIIAEGNGRLNARSVKIFADGALRSGGAALYEPYADNPETNGFMRMSADVLNSVIPQFLRDGWQVNVHAIGDRANGIVLDAFEAALKGVNVTALRPRLEHAQIMTKADMARVGKLGVIASVQPTHAISDMWYAEDRLGPERVKGLYAFRSLIDSGARITLGSDFPVEDMNPLSGFYAAITRVSPEGNSPHGPEGWFPDQRLTREEALKGMTLDAAYASFTESSLGSIVPGKRADYVVLSQDIMSIPTKQILDTKVLATVIDGKPVFGQV